MKKIQLLAKNLRLYLKPYFSTIKSVKLVNHLIFWKFMEEKGYFGSYCDIQKLVKRKVSNIDNLNLDILNRVKTYKEQYFFKKKDNYKNIKIIMQKKIFKKLCNHSVLSTFWRNEEWKNKNYKEINEIWENLPNYYLGENETKSKFKEIIENYNFPEELDRIKDDLFKTINDISEIEGDFFGKMYEEFLSTIADAGNLGEFYTPRHIVEFMTFILESLGLDDGKTVCDPSCGSGGFLVKLFEDVYKNKRNDENIHGWEINQDSYIFALMNMFVHGDGKAQLKNIDSLDEKHYTEFFDTFNYIIANPPYGAKGLVENDIIVDYLLRKEQNIENILDYKLKDEKKEKTLRDIVIEKSKTFIGRKILAIIGKLKTNLSEEEDIQEVSNNIKNIIDRFGFSFDEKKLKKEFEKFKEIKENKDKSFNLNILEYIEYEGKSIDEKEFRKKILSYIEEELNSSLESFKYVKDLREYILLILKNNYNDILGEKVDFKNLWDNIINEVYQVSTNNSELLFLQLIWATLENDGWAFVIVPEGVNFRNSNADVYTRKWLCEHSSEFFVFSLPSGAFLPYTGVKTSIYLFRKTLDTKEAVKTIKYIEIENDGYSLDKKRRQIGEIVDGFEYVTDKSDFWKIMENFGKLKGIIEKIKELNKKLTELKKEKSSLDNENKNKNTNENDNKNNRIKEVEKEINKFVDEIDKKYSEIDNLGINICFLDIKNIKDCNFSCGGDKDKNCSFKKEKIKKFVDIQEGYAFKSKDLVGEDEVKDLNKGEYVRVIKIGDFEHGKKLKNEKKVYYVYKKNEDGSIEKDKKRLEKYKANVGDIVVAMTGATVGKIGEVNEECLLNQRVGKFIITDNQKINRKILKYILLSGFYEYAQEKAAGAGVENISSNQIKQFEICFPPLEIQKQIVQHLENMQILKDKSEKLEEILKEEVGVESEFFEMEGGEVKKLEEIGKIVRGASPRPIDKYITEDKNGVNWVKISDATIGKKYITNTKEKISTEGAKSSRWVNKGNLILSNSGRIGEPYILKIDGCIYDGWVAINTNLNSNYMYYYLYNNKVKNKLRYDSKGSSIKNLNIDIVGSILVPLISYPIQLQLAKYFHTYFLFQQIISNLENTIVNLQKNYLEGMLTDKEVAVDWILKEIENAFEEEKAVEDEIKNIYEKIKFKINNTISNSKIDLNPILKDSCLEKEDIEKLEEYFNKKLLDKEISISGLLGNKDFLNTLYSQIEQLVLNIKQKNGEVFNYKLYKKIKQSNQQYFNQECKLKFVVDIDAFETYWRKFNEHLYDVVQLVICDLENISKGLRFTYNQSRARTFIDQFMLFLAWITDKVLKDLTFDIGQLNGISFSNTYLPNKDFEQVYNEVRQNYYFTKEQILNYYLSSLTKQFVIFWGITGIGKSKLAKEFPKALYGESEFTKYYKHIAVKSKWEDDKEIKGFYDHLEDDYREGEFISIAKKALLDRKNPYFVLLDEMNLSKIEHYLSDFLSFVETMDNRGVESLEEISLYDEFYLSSLKDFVSSMEQYFTNKFLLVKDNKSKDKEDDYEYSDDKDLESIKIIKELFYLVRTEQTLRLVYDLLLENKVFGIQSVVFKNNEKIDDYKKLLYIIGKYLGEEYKLQSIFRGKLNIKENYILDFLEKNSYIFEGLVLGGLGNEISNTKPNEEEFNKWMENLAKRLDVDENKLKEILTYQKFIKIEKEDENDKDKILYSNIGEITTNTGKQIRLLAYKIGEFMEEEDLLDVYINFYKLNFISKSYNEGYLDLGDFETETESNNDLKIEKMENGIYKFSKQTQNYLSDFIYLAEYKFHYNEKSKKSKREQIEEFRQKLVSKLKEGYVLKLVSVDEQISGRNIFTLTVGDLENAKFELGIRIPDNLYITGTMNVDEAGEMISPKVIDRANIIEWNEVCMGDGNANNIFGALPFLDCENQRNNQNDRNTDINLRLEDKPFCFEITDKIYPDRIKEVLCSNNNLRNSERLKEFSRLLAKIYHITKKANIHFGYRTINEILTYLINFEKRLNFGVPIQEKQNNFYKLADLQLYQKILPKFRVSGSKGKEVVEEMMAELLSIDLNNEIKIEIIRGYLEKGEEGVKEVLKNNLSISINDDFKAKETNNFTKIFNLNLLNVKDNNGNIGDVFDKIKDELRKQVHWKDIKDINNNRILKININEFFNRTTTIPENIRKNMKVSLKQVIQQKIMKDLSEQIKNMDTETFNIVNFTHYPKTFQKLLNMLENYDETGMIDYWS